MRFLLLPVLLSVSISPHFLKAQKTDSSSLATDYAALLEQLDQELDSLSIFLLLDSLLSADFKMPSDLIVRVGYNNQVVSAGRTFGLNQHGYSGGVTFYHKTGFFADVTGFSSPAFDPNYNLTLASVGYLGTFKTKWSYTINYEHYFYNTNPETTRLTSLLNHSAGAAGSYIHKYFSANLDYSFFFGESTAHRVIANLSGNLTLKNKWIFNRITFMPTASIMFGNDEVTIRFTEQIRQDLKLSDALQGVELSPQERLGLIRIRRQLESGNITQEQAERRALLVLLNNPEARANMTEFIAVNEQKFGLMNYSFNLPVIFTIKKLSISTAYIYSIPVQLPTDTFRLSPIGFFSAGISYRFSFK